METTFIVLPTPFNEKNLIFSPHNIFQELLAKGERAKWNQNTVVVNKLFPLPHYFYRFPLNSESLKKPPHNSFVKKRKHASSCIVRWAAASFKGFNSFTFCGGKKGRQQVKWEFHFTVVFTSPNLDSNSSYIQ